MRIYAVGRCIYAARDKIRRDSCVETLISCQQLAGNSNLQVLWAAVLLHWHLLQLL